MLVGRCAVPQPRSPGRTAVRRRPSGDAAGRAVAERGPALLPDGAERDRCARRCASAGSGVSCRTCRSGISRSSAAPRARRRCARCCGSTTCRTRPKRAAAIAALIGVSARRREPPGVPGARAGAFCRGLDVTLEFEPRPGRAAGSIFSPRCSTAFWRCTRRSTRLSAPPPCCAAAGPRRRLAGAGRHAGAAVMPRPVRGRLYPSRISYACLAEPRRFRFDAAVAHPGPRRGNAPTRPTRALPLGPRPRLPGRPR